MAKTRKRKNKEDEALGGFFFLISFGVYYFTRSLEMSIIAFFLSLALFLGFVMWRKQKKDARLRRSGIHEIDQMDGFQFEHYLEQLFKSQGFKVKVTKSRGDYGADLILEGKQKKIAIQAKRYSKSVGIKAVQEVATSLHYYKASEAWVVTNSSFTRQAREMAASSSVRLIDREQLINMVLNMNPNAEQAAKKTLSTVKVKEIRCKKCGHQMEVKNGRHGRFYGCENYPSCRKTKAI